MTRSSSSEPHDCDAYEALIGRWSRLVASEFIDWLAVERNRAWLDVGCGAGALTHVILERRDPARIEACDLSPTFLERARLSNADARVSFCEADACSLPYGAGTFDAAVSGLVLPMIDDKTSALGEMTRVMKAGGVVAAYVWDFFGEMQLLRYFWEAATALEPGSDEEDSRFDICRPGALAEALRAAGLAGVDCRSIDAPTVFPNFDAYWNPFLRGTSRAQRHVRSLDDARRAKLREHVRANLPIARDGSISLIARAWAAKGVKT